MRIDNLKKLLDEITGSYFMVTNNFYKANGEKQVAYQYVAGMDSKRAFTILKYDKYGNEYIVVNDDDCDEPFCYSWIYKNKEHLDSSDYVFFNIENPKDLISQILRFLERNSKNIDFNRLYSVKRCTKVYLKHNSESTQIAEVLTDRTKLVNNEYIHFNYRNIDIIIEPISERIYNEKTQRYNNWVDDDIKNTVEL